MCPRKLKTIHAVNMFDSYYVMICSNEIISVENTPKKIYPSVTILNEFTSTYYDDKNDYFEMLFQNYAASDVNKIYHPSIIE